jgi:hypothetical protein
MKVECRKLSPEIPTNLTDRGLLVLWGTEPLNIEQLAQSAHHLFGTAIHE